MCQCPELWQAVLASHFCQLNIHGMLFPKRASQDESARTQSPSLPRSSNFQLSRQRAYLTTWVIHADVQLLSVSFLTAKEPTINPHSSHFSSRSCWKRLKHHDTFQIWPAMGICRASSLHSTGMPLIPNAPRHGSIACASPGLMASLRAMAST